MAIYEVVGVKPITANKDGRKYKILSILMPPTDPNQGKEAKTVFISPENVEGYEDVDVPAQYDIKCDLKARVTEIAKKCELTEFAV